MATNERRAPRTTARLGRTTLADLVNPERRQAYLTRLDAEIRAVHDVNPELIVGPGLRASRMPQAIAAGGDTANVANVVNMVIRRTKAGIRFIHKFPCTSAMLAGQGVADVVEAANLVCGPTARSYHELAVRAALLAAGLVTEDHVGPIEAFGVADMTGEVPPVPEYVTDEETHTNLILWGHCLIVMLITRAFVSAPSVGALRQLNDLKRTMQIEGPTIAADELRELANSYSNPMDTMPYLRYIASSSFEGQPQLIAYHRRFGQGSSHIAAITSAYRMYPGCPFWGKVPKHEWESYFTALQVLNIDPLALHPANNYDPADTDPLRATGMPSLMNIAIILLTQAGEYSWSSYNNIPHVNKIGGLNLPDFRAVLTQWHDTVRQVTVDAALRSAAVGEIIDLPAEIREIMDRFEQSVNRAPIARGQVLDTSSRPVQIGLTVRTHQGETTDLYEQAGTEPYKRGGAGDVFGGEERGYE